MAGWRQPVANDVPLGGFAEGGEPACWAHLVCPDCGAMEAEGHRPDCAGDSGAGPAAGRGLRSAALEQRSADHADDR
jgi:hypothetical protein